MQRLQWGWFLHGFTLVPLAGSFGAVILVPMFSPFYPERYRSEAALEDLTGNVILWYIALFWFLLALRGLMWHRQRVRVYPDRVEFVTGALIGRRVRRIGLDSVKRIGSRRALFGFGRYGVVTIRGRRPRKTKFAGVRGHRELEQALRDALAAKTVPMAAEPPTAH